MLPHYAQYEQAIGLDWYAADKGGFRWRAAGTSGPERASSHHGSDLCLTQGFHRGR